MTDDSNNDRQQKIVIVGNGVEAFMAATSLSETVNRNQIDISLLSWRDENPNTRPFAFADSMGPFERPSFLPALNNEQLLKHCSGTLTHGIAMSGWAAPDATYFHPYGSIGAALGPVSFLQVVLRLRHQGAAVRLADFSLAALAAQSGKCVPAVKDPRSVLATCQHGMHVELEKLSGQLRSAAGFKAVNILDGFLDRCERNQHGDIETIITSEGDHVKADLYIDCTGQQALLCESGADAQWQDWSEWLPCNRLMSVVLQADNNPPSYSHDFATISGWIQDIPLQGKALLNGLYNDNSTDEDGMLEQILRYTGSRNLEHIASNPLVLGRRSRAWQGNCISLGSAAAMIDPVATSNLQLLATGVERLTKLLPGGTEMSAVRKEYNRQMSLYFDHARDFAIMLYKLNGRHGDTMWDQCRNLKLPDELDYKLRLYQSRGLVALYDEEPFEESSWLTLFDAHNIQPRQYSTIADGFALQSLQEHLQKIRAVMLEALPKLPSHADYLAHIKRKQK